MIEIDRAALAGPQVDLVYGLLSASQISLTRRQIQRMLPNIVVDRELIYHMQRYDIIRGEAGLISYKYKLAPYVKEYFEKQIPIAKAAMIRVEW